MVDFNNEATIGTPALDIVKVLILQRRSDLMEALEQYNKYKFRNAELDLSTVKARLLTLFLEIQASLKRNLAPEDYNSLLEKVRSYREEDLNEAVLFINEELDRLRLIRFDTRRKIDATRVENENLEKGM